MRNEPNDECRISNVEGMTKPDARTRKQKHRLACSSFDHRSLFRHSSFVIRHSALTISLAFSVSLNAQAPPSAKDILDSVRMIESRQQIDLQGQLRQDEVVIPFRLMQNGPRSEEH